MPASLPAFVPACLPAFVIGACSSSHHTTLTDRLWIATEPNPRACVQVVLYYQPEKQQKRMDLEKQRREVEELRKAYEAGKKAAGSQA